MLRGWWMWRKWWRREEDMKPNAAEEANPFAMLGVHFTTTQG